MSKYQFPLKDEKEFELLVNDLCAEKYGFDFQVYGRKGQTQSGIDGLSFAKNEKQIVFQCKNKLIARDDTKIQKELLADIEDEVQSASTKFTNIDTFIFANSFKQDTVLQDRAIELTFQYGFTVVLWSWEEIEGLLEKYPTVAKHYYPWAFDKSVLSENDIKQKFHENSVSLLSSSSLYIEKSFIDMPEFDEIFEFINSENYKDDLLVLTGKAGIGKTAILSKIQSVLIENNMAYLSIKSDKIDIESRDSLSKFFGVEDILHSIKQLSRKEKVIVLIDQLDALSLTMSSNQKVINIILGFIEQLKYISNVKIIVSIREYDLKNDPLFKHLDDSNVIRTQLLSFEYVNDKLKSFVKESVTLNNTLIELLRTPLHLSIFIDLYPNDNSCISIKTLQDLYNKFWEQKVNSESIDRTTRQNSIKLLNSVVQKMNEIKKIEVPALYFEDEFKEEMRLLCSNGILKQENNKISFFHQTFYEYLFAKAFMKKGKSLYQYIVITSQDLSIREQFKQIIQFLKGTNEEQYLLELKNILYSDKVRFHIKLLLISYLGSLENPTTEEFAFVKKLFTDDKNFEKYFIESWISADWLIYFKKDGFFNDENFKKYNLHYRLETFVNKEPYLVLEILDECEFDSEFKDEAIMLSLEKLDNWNDYSFAIFDKYHHVMRKENVRFDIEKIYKKVYLFNQEYAIHLFFDFLDTLIKEANNNKNDLLDYHWYKIFEFLVAMNNQYIFQKLLESIQKISSKFERKHAKKEFLITDQVFDSWMWKYDSSNHSTLRLYRKTLEKISQVAIDDKDVFIELIKPYQDTRYLSLISFLIFGYSKNPDDYKNEILALLTNIKLLEEMSFDHDDGYELVMLLTKSFHIYDVSEQEKIFNSIFQVNPKWESSYYVGKCHGTYFRLKKYELLSQLDIEDIKKFGYLKEFQELQRKFYWYKLKKPHNVESGWVGAPFDEEVYKKMSLNNWLQSMKVFDGTVSRKSMDSFLRGSKTEHHRQFEKEVTEKPDNFYDLLLQLKSENIHADYLSAGLSGLIASNYDAEKVLKITHLYSDIENSWLKRTILKAMKHLIHRDKFDDSLITILEANRDIKYEGLIRDKDKFQTIHDYMSSSINSFEGDFAELLPLVYKNVVNDENSTKRVMSLIDNVIDKNVDFVIFGLLRTLGNIESVDKILFAKLLVNLIEKDEIGQVSIFSLHNFHYLYLNEYVSKEQLLVYIKKCISFANNVKDKEDAHYINNLGMFLFYYYVTEKDEIFEEMLNEAISSNSQIIHGVLHQIFEQELHSKDQEKVEKSKQFILKFKNDEENDYFYTYDLAKMKGLNFIQDDFAFIKSLAESLNIRKEVKSFIEYLQNEYYLDTNLSEKIFELLEVLIHNIDANKEMGYYDSRPLIEFILELNTRAKSDEKKIGILDLLDKFLMSDTLRHTTKSAID
ncbi:MAG: ATP-binding protein [Sulfuricurvum sp.]|uniref:NACHT domain-containing protein n=1 Tax=Sulfuricurvum sp. TaxID=2025608 RepID=UPI002625CAEF|nr:ATP-binding protein [Sulfuricurvum sp.]MDD2828955.1 ATP-binding protein [Sulfuricurvum sp.]MDD4950054.1 ATP-binding protein [Sulfuricurvum sp.]